VSPEPWKCEGCGWTNVGYVTACDGCGEDRATAVFDRAALRAEVVRYRRSLMAQEPDPATISVTQGGIGDTHGFFLPPGREETGGG
jgi:hypothetical protein